MSKIKVAIIGCGTIANAAHIPSYLNNPKAEIKYFCDIIPERAEAAVKQYGCGTAIEDYHVGLNDPEIQAVSVCTPNYAHPEIAIAAMRAGKDVLCEKPAARTYAEALEMKKGQNETGRILNIGVVNRFNDNVNAIKKYIDQGKLGEVFHVYVSFRAHRSIPGLGGAFTTKAIAGGGALIDWGVHYLDIVMYCCGDPKPLTVSGYTSNFFGTNPLYQRADQDHTAEENATRFNVDDFAAAFVRLEGGIILDFRISWAMHLDTPGDTIILGKKGALRIPSTECWNGSVGGEMTLYSDVAGLQTETKFPILKSGKDLFELKVRSFLDAIKEGTPAPVPSAQIYYNQAIIDGIMKSAALGREIELEIPEV